MYGNENSDITAPEDIKYKVVELDTTYNGKCQLFKFKQSIEPKNYLHFQVPKNNAHFMMIIPQGLEIFMVTQQWPEIYTPQTNQIDTSQLMFLEKQSYLLVNQKEFPCGDNWNIIDFIQCFREDLIQQNANSCLPFYWYRVLIEYYPNITLCENEDENHEAFGHITDLMANYSKVRIKSKYLWEYYQANVVHTF